MAQLNSMTGFSVASADIGGGVVTLELRAVNARFLDIYFRLAEDFRTLEPAIRERLAETIKRGKVECRINYTTREQTRLPSEVNRNLIAQLGQLATQVREDFRDARPLTVAEILRWPGVLGEAGSDLEQLHVCALELLRDALRELQASRAQEGDKLAATILRRVEAMRSLVADLRPRTAEIVTAYRDKLTRRMDELLREADQERIHQEVALFAQKIDVDEELDRLSTHLDEVERVVRRGGAAGKRLDFLMQELHREANTLGSKSVSLELSQTSLELKVLIEQMREQVQNIE